MHRRAQQRMGEADPVGLSQEQPARLGRLRCVVRRPHGPGGLAQRAQPIGPCRGGQEQEVTHRPRCALQEPAHPCVQGVAEREPRSEQRLGRSGEDWRSLATDTSPAGLPRSPAPRVPPAGAAGPGRAGQQPLRVGHGERTEDEIRRGFERVPCAAARHRAARQEQRHGTSARIVAGVEQCVEREAVEPLRIVQGHQQRPPGEDVLVERLGRSARRARTAVGGGGDRPQLGEAGAGQLGLGPVSPDPQDGVTCGLGGSSSLLQQRGLAAAQLTVDRHETTGHTRPAQEVLDRPEFRAAADQGSRRRAAVHRHS